MPLTNVHFHLPALPEPSTRQVQQELLALPGVLRSGSTRAPATWPSATTPAAPAGSSSGSG